jgi:hydroxymethylbilane synthase
MTAALRLGTRASLLARTQSGLVADALRARGHAVELVEVSTRGDRSAAPLAQIGGTGVFVSALREALLDGRVDVAVHSLKDLPTAPAPGVALAAVPVREDPRDALVARDGLTLGELGEGAVVGTGSPRRAAQLQALGLGLRVVGVRGNVDTRLRMVSSGELDAVVLARAGLLRIGRQGAATEVLDPLQLLPAPGQGALAVECRADDAATLAALAVLDDPASRACVVAERTLLATLEGGCTAPVGALADWVEADPHEGTPAELYLRAVALAPDGSVDLRRSATGPADDPVGLGHRLAQVLLEDGAADLVREAPGPVTPGAPPGPPGGATHASAGSPAQEETFARIGSAAQESEQ